MMAAPVARRSSAARRQRARIQGKELPQAARDYIKKIADLVGVEVPLVSVGPDRDASVIDNNARTAGWLRP